MYFVNFVLVFVRPPGVFEFEHFSKGTKSLMDAIVKSTASGATTIIGETISLKSAFMIYKAKYSRGFAFKKEVIMFF